MRYAIYKFLNHVLAVDNETQEERYFMGDNRYTIMGTEDENIDKVVGGLWLKGLLPSV